MWHAAQQGWRDGTWVWRFSLYLLPCLLVAVAVAGLVDGRLGPEPTPLVWWLSSLAAVIAFALAAAAEGPEHWLGAALFIVLLVVVGGYVLWRTGRRLEVLRRHHPNWQSYNFDQRLMVFKTAMGQAIDELRLSSEADSGLGKHAVRKALERLGRRTA